MRVWTLLDYGVFFKSMNWLFQEWKQSQQELKIERALISVQLGNFKIANHNCNWQILSCNVGKIEKFETRRVKFQNPDFILSTKLFTRKVSLKLPALSGWRDILVQILRCMWVVVQDDLKDRHNEPSLTMILGCLITLHYSDNCNNVLQLVPNGLNHVLLSTLKENKKLNMKQ